MYWIRERMAGWVCERVSGWRMAEWAGGWENEHVSMRCFIDIVTDPLGYHYYELQMRNKIEMK